MPVRFARSALLILMVGGGLSLGTTSIAQEGTKAQSSEQPAAELPPVPKGVEVLARGPVHEAFATPTTDPAPTKPVPKAPPTPLEELPPAEKPEGNASWIGGYWAWDDERNDFLWVSGTWRAAPPGQRWVAGYWRADGSQWHWVPGFWTAAEKQFVTQPVTYLPEPPAVPQVASPGAPPTPESFYVPGHWVWHEAGYTTLGNEHVWRGAGYAWIAGYWAQVQPGYVWVPAHYRWTPGGHVFIPGYWDLVLAERGVLYAPVVVDTVLVGPGFVYTPAYAVRHEIVIDAMFVRPSTCHYYFGDYYGPAYRQLGYESCVVYSRRRYDAIFVYERYTHRGDPRWETLQIDVCMARHAGQAPCPPRTLVQQNILVQQNVTNVRNVTIIQNTTNNNRTTVNTSQVLVPSTQLASKGVRTVPLDKTARVQAQQQAQAIQQVGLQRHQVEVKTTAAKLTQPRAATLNLPPTQPFVSGPATAARPANAVRPATVATPNLATATGSAARTTTTAGPTGLQPATPAALADRAPSGPPAPVNNSTRLQPAVAATHPGSTPSAQPITSGKAPFNPRPTPPTMATSPLQRTPRPGIQPMPSGLLPRPFPSQQLQPRPTPAQKKPDEPEKTPAKEQRPS